MQTTTERFSGSRIKLQYFLIKREKEINSFLVFYLFFAIALGTYCFLTKREIVSFLFFGVHLCYPAGRFFWKLGERIFTFENRTEAPG